MFNRTWITYPGMQLVSCLVGSFLLVACASQSLARADLDLPSVAIDLVGDDGLTQALSIELRNAVSRTKTLRLAPLGSASKYSVKSDTNVDGLDFNGQSYLVYNVYLMSNSVVISHKSGRCLENKPGMCAQQIVDQFIRYIKP